MDIKRVLAIFAHPDDAEIYAGGTLALYASMGTCVFVYSHTDGSKGSLDTSLSEDEVAHTRIQEATAASNLINATFICGHVRDAEVYDTPEQRNLVIDIIRQKVPDVVLTHCPEDYHPDHRTLSKLLSDAVYFVGVPRYKTTHKAVRQLPVVYFADTLSGEGFVPTDFVDITQTMAVKQEMLRCHASQVKWLREHDGLDLLNMVESHAIKRAEQYGNGARYVEVFRTIPGIGTIPEKRVLP